MSAVIRIRPRSSSRTRATLGGTSRIRLVFDPATFALKQWSVIDPQGYETLVSLFNLNTTTKPDPSLFQITYETGRGRNPYK